MLLVARGQVRYASSVEAAAAGSIQADLSQTSERDDRLYRDIADETLTPKVDKRVKKTIFKDQRSSMRELIAPKVDLKALQALDPQDEVASSSRAVDQSGVASPSNDAAAKALQAPEPPSGVAPPPGSERKRRFLLDDVPASIKRSRLQERPPS